MSRSMASQTFKRTTASCLLGASRTRRLSPLENSLTTTLTTTATTSPSSSSKPPFLISTRSFSAQQPLCRELGFNFVYFNKKEKLRKMRIAWHEKNGYVRDEVVQPSEASGGIPEPTFEYLLQADQEWTRLEKAQPLLIIGDLNGTMLYRKNVINEPKKFIPRPHALTFINYMMDNFWFGFWSSARAQNVDAMVDQLVHADRKEELVMAWNRSHFGLTRADFKNRTMCYKRLSLIWNDPFIAMTHPDYENGGRWSQANTVLIDDTPEKARSEPYNVIVVPEFQDENHAHDLALLQVHDYINYLAFQSDVSACMRVKPFTLKSIPGKSHVDAGVTETEDAFMAMDAFRETFYSPKKGFRPGPKNKNKVKVRKGNQRKKVPKEPEPGQEPESKQEQG